MSEHVVDAHALIWFLEGNARLGANARSILIDSHSKLIVPATALAEACWVVAKQRTSLSDWRDLIVAVRNDLRIRVYPLDVSVVDRAMSLPVDLEMHDAQIVATGLVCLDNGGDIRIITKDQSITDSRLLPTVW